MGDGGAGKTSLVKRLLGEEFDNNEPQTHGINIKKWEIVDGEDKQHPLSDDALVNELANHGITVARRTVTKYRQRMNIPSSRQRRRWGD